MAGTGNLDFYVLPWIKIPADHDKYGQQAGFLGYPDRYILERLDRSEVALIVVVSPRKYLWVIPSAGGSGEEKSLEKCKRVVEELIAEEGFQFLPASLLNLR